MRKLEENKLNLKTRANVLRKQNTRTQELCFYFWPVGFAFGHTRTETRILRKSAHASNWESV